MKTILILYSCIIFFGLRFLWAIIHRITLKEIEFKISGVTSDTHKYIDSAIGNTTGHEHCYDKQHLEFEDVKNSAILVYYTCEAASIVQLSVPTAEMKEIAQKGKAAIEELEKILPAYFQSTRDKRMKTILILYSCIIFFSLQIYKLRISGVSNDIRKYIYSAVGNATGLEHCYNKQHVEFEEVKNKTLLVYYACEAASLVQLSVPTAEMVQIAQIGKLAIEELGKIISSQALRAQLSSVSHHFLADLGEEDNLPSIKTKYLAYIQRLISGIKKKLDILTAENFDHLWKIQILLTLTQEVALNLVQHQLNEDLNNITARVDAAVANGRDVKYCYTDQVNNFLDIHITAIAELRKCVKDSVQLFTGNFSSTHELYEDGKAAIAKLGGIQYECTLVVFTETKCIEYETEKAEFRVEDFNAKYIQRHVSREMSYMKTKNHCVLCFGNAVDEAKEKIAKLVFSTNSCITGA
ncbi:hypothetical protein KM043_018599 [Ampulex compressa]|nr:hypothetical protein KM043_018599 [Ampulex compressa]